VYISVYISVYIPVVVKSCISSTRGISACVVQEQRVHSRHTWERGWTSWSSPQRTLYRHKHERLANSILETVTLVELLEVCMKFSLPPSLPPSLGLEVCMKKCYSFIHLKSLCRQKINCILPQQTGQTIIYRWSFLKDDHDP